MTFDVNIESLKWVKHEKNWEGTIYTKGTGNAGFKVKKELGDFQKQKEINIACIVMVDLLRDGMKR